MVALVASVAIAAAVAVGLLGLAPGAAIGLGVGLLVANLVVLALARRGAGASEIAAAHRRWGEAADALGHGLFDWDVAADHIDIAPAFLASLGYDEAFGATLRARGTAAFDPLIHPETYGRLRERLRAHFANEVKEVVIDVRMRAHDGSWRWIEYRGVAIIRDPEGKPLRVMGVLVDVTRGREATATLTELQESMDLAVAAGGVGLWDADLKTRTYRANAQLEVIHGLAPAAGAARRLADWVAQLHPDDRARVGEEITTGMRELRNIRGEYRIIRGDGETRHLRSVGRVQADEHGVAARAVGTTIDVTHERMLAEAYERERERLRVATQVAQIGIWELDVTNQRATWDARMHTLFGFEPGTFDGDLAKWGARIHPDDLADAIAVSTKTITTGQPSHERYRIIRPDGEVRWIRTATSGFDVTRGTPPIIVGSSWDVTDETRLTEALEAEKERFAMALAAGEIGLWEHDFARDQQFWDARSHAIYDGTIDFRADVAPNVYGGTHAEYLAALPPEARAGLLRVMQAMGPEKNDGVVDLDLRTRTGERRIVRSYARMMFKDGVPVRLTGLHWDVTKERLAAEGLARARDEADRANRAKSEFLASMSHEIRTPMNGVLGMAELVLDTPLTREQREFVETIHASADSLLAVIDDILDLAKIEAGKVELVPLDFELRTSLTETLKPLRVRAQAKGLTLEHHVADDVPVVLHADWGRVRQVLVNLIGNAVKFTAKGQVDVDVDVVGRPERGAVTLRFAVRDTGIGIDPALQERVFVPFEQADGSISRRFGGTGLGLAISARLVTMLGGTLTLDSTVGRGSTFMFVLPLGLGSRPRVLRDTLPPTPKPPVHNGLTVLIAEDNLVNQRVAQLMLEKRGYAVHLVDDGRKAIAAACARHFDVVLMDVQMPDVDGLEATRVIRTTEAGSGRHTPIIAVTAHAMAAERERCLASGFDDYLTKPLRADALADALDNVLARAGRASP